MTEGGWHEVARLDELPEREVRRATVGRTELIVWRHPTTGAAVCQEAWCPHAWADLKGARVTDDGCIECPFHSWRFDASGWHVRLFAPPGGSAPAPPDVPHPRRRRGRRGLAPPPRQAAAGGVTCTVGPCPN